jgi:hypothetical protein
MQFPTIVLALAGVASAQFPFGGFGGGGGYGGGYGWGFAPSCAVCIPALHLGMFQLTRSSNPAYPPPFLHILQPGRLTAQALHR